MKRVVSGDRGHRRHGWRRRCASRPSRPRACEAALDAALQEMSASQLGTLTVGDLAQLAARISIAEQQDHYVQRARTRRGFPRRRPVHDGRHAGRLALPRGRRGGGRGDPRRGVSSSSRRTCSSSTGLLRRSPLHHQVAVGGQQHRGLPAVGRSPGGRDDREGVSWGTSPRRTRAKRARQNIDDGKVTFTPNFDFVGTRVRG